MKIRPGYSEDPYKGYWDDRNNDYTFKVEMKTKSGRVLFRRASWLPGEDPAPKLEAARRLVIEDVRKADRGDPLVF
jgi:hypothetical protein